MAMFSGDGIGVDLGSSTTKIHLAGEGIVLREASSVLALKSDSQQVISLGDEARAMLGRTAEETMLYAPVMDGAVTDVDIAALLVLALTERATGRRKPMEKSRLMLSVSLGLTKVERQAIETVARLAGSKRTSYVKTPLAAALGAGLNVSEPRGIMVAVLGGGTTEIAVLSMNGIVAARSMRTGSLSMDEAIVRYVRKKKGLIIGLRTAEDIKCDIGSAQLPDYDVDEGGGICADQPEAQPEGGEADERERAQPEGERVLLKGRDAKTGLPMTVEITTRDIALALREPVRILVDALSDALMRTPEELASDVLSEGIHLSGGGALLVGLAEVLSEHTGVPVHVSEHPEDDVLMGIGRLLDDERLYQACLEAGTVET